MGKLLIIKTGTTYDRVIKKYGDCDYLITSKIGIPYSDSIVVPVYENIVPKLQEDITKIIITGSDAMVTQRLPWSVRTEEWLREIVDKGIPILGICYGHQLLAQALGGVVDYHHKGVEYGEVEIELNEYGMEDELFRVLPSKFSSYVAHSQSIKKIPPNSKVLAKNNFENSHIVRFREKVWGVQFHPEFNEDIEKIHVDEEQDYLIDEGLDPDSMIRNIKENEYGKIILQRFYYEINSRITKSLR